MIVEKSEKCGRITRNNRGERKSKTRSFSCARSLDRSLTRSIARSLARSLAHWRELYIFFLLSQEFFFFYCLGCSLTELDASRCRAEEEANLALAASPFSSSAEEGRRVLPIAPWALELVSSPECFKICACRRRP
jgi:hypothetical protein